MRGQRADSVCGAAIGCLPVEVSRSHRARLPLTCSVHKRPLLSEARSLAKKGRLYADDGEDILHKWNVSPPVPAWECGPPLRRRTHANIHLNAHVAVVYANIPLQGVLPPRVAHSRSMLEHFLLVDRHERLHTVVASSLSSADGKLADFRPSIPIRPRYRGDHQIIRPSQDYTTGGIIFSPID